MTISRRALLSAAASVPALSVLPGRRARAQAKPVLKIGVLCDMSGTYRDIAGPTGLACTKQAVQDFAAGGFDVEVLNADHQNKPDLAVSIANQWFDQDGVTMIIDITASSCALALAGPVREKNRVMIPTSTATSDLTGKACSPNHIHWVYDTYMDAKSTGGAMVKAGGETWYFITPNYAFGQALQRDTTHFIEQAGGKVLGYRLYPFPDTTDFSSLLVQAQASGAKVLGFCSAGADLINGMKQAAEFGVSKKMKPAALTCYTCDVHSMGLQLAQGLRLTETYYWDLNDRTRAFQSRVQGKVTVWPASTQAGNYSGTLHYLKAVAAMGGPAMAKDGRAVVETMKKMPTDDDCFGKGYIRADGRKMHPAYLFEVKTPAESKHEWDQYKLIGSTPAEEAFRPLAEGGCPMIKV
ncbi:MAG TPA: ABC transporter substrate-binding protein [Acetobacteraceae bacterium]|nr:ABC transporter substrate-binding protein [Acetobacteraceae bacterium]